MPFVAFCCSSLLVLVFEVESVKSQTPKQANTFGCSFWLFVVHSVFVFLFLQMFPFEHCPARFGFC